MINYPRATGFIVLLLVALRFGILSSQTYRYPTPMRVDVIDTYHGISVADPYRWMENTDSPELKEWISAQNAATEAYLSSVPAREKLRSRFTALWNYSRYSVPFHKSNRYFFSRNDGLQNQSVVYMQDNLGAEARIALDPNTWSTDGTVSLGTQAYRKDGSMVAYGVSRSGSDVQEIRIKDLNSGNGIGEVLQWCRFPAIAWHPDKPGFYYNRYPEAGTVAKEDEVAYNKVYWHTVGTPQSADTLVFERPDAKELNFSPVVTEDGRYLILYVWKGTDPVNRIYYREIDGHGPFVRLLDKADANYTLIDDDENIFYIQTNLEAPRERIVAIDLRHPDPESWREIIPQQEDVITASTVINNRFVIASLKDAYSRLRIFDLEGQFLREIPLPTIGSVGSISGEREDKEMFFSFTSFLYPTTIFRYSFVTDSLTIFRTPNIPFDISGYETKQVFYHSKDGTRIPMFVTAKKNILLDGTNPTLLYGYGGFNINMTPSFQPWRLVWLERGGVYAMPCLRGGSEYGEQWHQSGMLEKKQNVFDDFIAAAQWLIEHRYTSSPRLAIMGGSNGGLLTAACMLQQPNLFGAVVSQVPVTDMLRYHRFTIGRYWVGEYGNAEEDSTHFRFLHVYSPLHNVNPGVSYPPILITTADHDDRVFPAHAMKFAATLQAASPGTNPILIRIETKAGHGGGKPTTKVIEEMSDTFTFLYKTLGISSGPDK